MMLNLILKVNISTSGGLLVRGRHLVKYLEASLFLKDDIAFSLVLEQNIIVFQNIGREGDCPLAPVAPALNATASNPRRKNNSQSIFKSFSS